MGYYIANGAEYLHVLKEPIDGCGYEAITNAEGANYFTKEDAKHILSQLNINKHWGLRKVRNLASGKNWIITTGSSLVSSQKDYDVTNSLHNAKVFHSVADAETYMTKHHVFEDAVIIDSNGNECKTQTKYFTNEQLSVLGVTSMKKVKRIKITSPTRLHVYKVGKGICGICGKPVAPQEFTIDHVVPLDRGGTNHLENLQIACDFCNKLKSNSLDSEIVNGATTILSNKINTYSESNKDIAYPIVRSYVRGMINDMFEGSKLNEFYK